MIERQIELKRRYHRKKKMAKLKAKLPTATGEERANILRKIHHLSPAWTEASLKPVAEAAAPKADEEPKKKPPAKPKPAAK